MNYVKIGCIVICAIVFGAAAYQTVANNVQTGDDPVLSTEQSVENNTACDNMTYIRLYPSASVEQSMQAQPPYLNSAECIFEEQCNDDENYVYVAEEGVMKWSWYTVNTNALPKVPHGYVDEVIVTIRGRFTGQATTHVCTAVAPRGYTITDITTEFISRNQSVIYPYYQEIQYKWEHNPADDTIYKTWEWEDIKNDFQIGVGAYYNNYNSQEDDGELRISQMYVDVGIEGGTPRVETRGVNAVSSTNARVAARVINDGGSPCSVKIEYKPADAEVYLNSVYVSSISSANAFTAKLQGLQPDTEYKWRICGMADGIASPYVYGESFTTQ